MVAQPTSPDPESLVARIIEELQANPEAQTLLLRALLTNEFLGMPARLDRLEADIAEMKIDIAALKADVAGLKVDVAELKVDVAELKTDVAGLKTDVSWLKADASGLKTDVSVLKGDSLEAKLHRRARPILSQKFGLRGAQVLHSTMQEMKPDLSRPLGSALDNGAISDDQETRLDTTDIILRGQRKTDRSEVWVAVEASNSIGDTDVRRASESAAALRAIFQQDVIAVVMGYRIRAEDEERAAEAGVQVQIMSENS